MPYDYQRGLKYGALGAGMAYFASSALSSVAEALPYGKDERYKGAIAAGVSVIAVDAAVQLFL
jgi:hypothetical protein